MELRGGGEGSIGFKHSEETKKIMSIKRSGSLHYRFGKHCSKKSKEKMSKAKDYIKKPVVQFTLEGEKICEFSSAYEASKLLEIPDTHIREACKKKLKTSGGYKWEYKNG